MSTLQSAGSWLPIACLLVFTFVFTVGLGPEPWVFLGELFPADVRYFKVCIGPYKVSWLESINGELNSMDKCGCMT